MKLNLNAVFSFSEVEGFTSGLWRLIALCPLSRRAVIIHLSSSNRIIRPACFPKDIFVDLWREQRIVEAEFALPWYQLQPDSEIETSAIDVRNRRFEAISGAVSDLNFLVELASSKRSKILRHYATTVDESSQNIWRWLTLYWKYGQQKNALLPAYVNCGGVGKIRQPGRQKRGRPRTKEVPALQRNPGINIGEYERGIFLKELNRQYLRKKPAKLHEIYSYIIETYYTDAVIAAQINGKCAATPSIEQFYYWVPILLQDENVARKQLTDREFSLNRRGLSSDACVYTPLPGSCFEIDATTADVHLVSVLNENHCIGRATVYSLVDKASRMIVGIYIGLEHESWAAAKQALLNCILAKKSYCAKYGINIVEEQWPCAHFGQTLIGDRGTMLSKELRRATLPHTTIELTGTERADMKAIVEKRFGLFKEGVWDSTPGTTLGKPVKRRDRDPKKDAVYTLPAFTEKMIEYVLKHNNECQFDDLALNSLILENDLAPTPLNFWNVHIENNRHALRRINEDEARAMILEPAQASVTDRGILFKDIYYVCDQAREEDWFSIARDKGRWKIDARIHLDDASEFYVRKNQKSPFVKCRMKSKFKIVDGLPLAEVRYLSEWKKEKKEKHAFSSESIARRKRLQRLEHRTREAQKAAPKNKTQKERTENIRERRKVEMATLKDASVNNPASNVTRLPLVRRTKDEKLQDLLRNLADELVGDEDV